VSPAAAPAAVRAHPGGDGLASELGYSPPPLSYVRQIIQRALDEDVAWGDVTTDNSVPADQRSRAVLLAKQPAVLCGGQVFAETFALVDPSVTVEFLLPDGTEVSRGEVAARVEGPTRALLTAERTALNFVQRLSGIATTTAAYAACLRGLPTKLIDTRKTTPGLRVLEKYAVRVGGGHNHRFNLADGVLMKDNHLAALRSRGLDLAEAIRTIKRRIPHTMRAEVEVTSLDQIDAALAGGADVILLDNMSTADMRSAVKRIAGRALTECSGNVTLETVRERAETGVDLISSGALTHSARAVDLSLEIDVG
jgi:nicotinate-nucleotide pyrophosphorylase (carboxylating)